MITKRQKKCQKMDNDQAAFKIIKREMLRDKVALGSFIFIAVIIIFVFIASLIIDQTQALLDDFTFGIPNQAPSRNHLLGTDPRGRDGFLILIVAARNTFTFTILITLTSSIFGIIYGSIAGYTGGRLDSFMMRIIEGISILPNVVIMIAFIGIIGMFSVFSFIVMMSLFTWTGVAKMIRAKIIQEKELEYVQASKTLGTPHFKIIFQQVLPNLSTIISASIILNAVVIIGIETGLSFIGFGFPHYMPSLGTLIATARSLHVLLNRWWVWLPATFLIVSIMFSINSIGSMLDRATDARSRD